MEYHFHDRIVSDFGVYTCQVPYSKTVEMVRILLKIVLVI